MPFDFLSDDMIQFAWLPPAAPKIDFLNLSERVRDAAEANVLVDTNPRPHKYFGGTAGDDFIVTNGLTKVIFGGGGDDEINPGIISPTLLAFFRDEYVALYGGVSDNKDRGHPDKFTHGRPGAIGSLYNSGNDTLHLGDHVEGKGGDGFDDYFIHGPHRAGSAPAFVNNFNFDKDELFIDHTGRGGNLRDGAKGWDLTNIKYWDMGVDEDGFKFVEFKAATLTTYSANEIVRTQQVIVQHHDNGVEEYVPEIIRYFGDSAKDEVFDHFKAGLGDWWH